MLRMRRRERHDTILKESSSENDAMTPVEVKLTDDAQSFVDEQVATGRFRSPSDFIANLIDQARRHAAHERVERLLLQGLDSGEGIEVTPDWWSQKADEWANKYAGEASP